ncbi:MAG: endonuclease/exonuclease/phosphatase family protein [Planctomycetota bacterium]
MPRLLTRTTLPLLTLLLAGCVTPREFGVMTFNIRTAGADDGPNHWNVRKDLAFDVIRRHQPDILGLQEVLASQAADLRKALPEYAFVGWGRDDGAQGGEYVPILYRKSRFTLVDAGCFWLSEDPRRPGSKGWDAACPRIATWVRLRFVESPWHELQVVNVHFDHRGKVARAESATLLRRYCEALGRPLVIMGDFNCDPGSEPYRILTGDRGDLAQLRDAQACVDDVSAAVMGEQARASESGDRAVPTTARALSTTRPSGDALRPSHDDPRHPPQGDRAGLPNGRPAPSGTYHAFNGQPRSGRIDWILLNRDLVPVSTLIDDTATAGRYPSDHFPVIARVRLPRASPRIAGLY